MHAKFILKTMPKRSKPKQGRVQAEYNQYAPILMTSVDTDPLLCVEERNAIMQRLGVGKWQIFGAHGFKKDYSVNT